VVTFEQEQQQKQQQRRRRWENELWHQWAVAFDVAAQQRRSFASSGFECPTHRRRRRCHDGSRHDVRARYDTTCHIRSVHKHADSSLTHCIWSRRNRGTSRSVSLDSNVSKQHSVRVASGNDSLPSQHEPSRNERRYNVAERHAARSPIVATSTNLCQSRAQHYTVSVKQPESAQHYTVSVKQPESRTMALEQQQQKQLTNRGTGNLSLGRTLPGAAEPGWSRVPYSAAPALFWAQRRRRSETMNERYLSREVFPKTVYVMSILCYSSVNNLSNHMATIFLTLRTTVLLITLPATPTPPLPKCLLSFNWCTVE
jgi:hypothetical protein